MIQTAYGILQQVSYAEVSNTLDLKKVKRRVMRGSTLPDTSHPGPRVYREEKKPNTFWYRIKGTGAVKVTLGTFWVTFSFADKTKRALR